MTWTLYDAPCFTSAEGTLAPGHDNGAEVIKDTTCFVPMVRANLDRERGRFIVLLPDSVASVPGSWVAKTREEIQEQYGVGSEFDMHPMPGWGA
jgi:hypothetical protein